MYFFFDGVNCSLCCSFKVVFFIVFLVDMDDVWENSQANRCYPGIFSQSQK